MLLSVCILMKNDAGCLNRLAGSLKNIPDEIVVVCDAPAGEDFRRVADACGARLVPHHWQNDFSSARNAGLVAARGTWVFWMDSDETLIGPDAATFREILQRPEMLGYYVTIEDQTGDSQRSSRQHPSLYRRRDELRYHGRIHEHFEPSLETVATQLGLKVAASTVRLTHTGYQVQKRREKVRRNIALLELELADRPGQFYYQVELGRMLLLSGQVRGHDVLRQAAERLLPLRCQGDSPCPVAATLLEYALTYAPAGFPLSSEMAVELARRWFPSSAPLAWLAARWHYQRGDMPEAARLLRSVLDMGEKGTFDHTVSFDQKIFGDETRLNLGVCCAKLGRITEATGYFNAIQAGSVYYNTARQNLRQLRRSS
jgi:hypothetical protein